MGLCQNTGVMQPVEEVDVLEIGGRGATPEDSRDTESLKWLNNLMVRMWPHWSKALETEVLTTVVHDVQDQLPDWLVGLLSIDRCSLGTEPPVLSAVRVTPTSTGVRFQVHLDVDLAVDISGYCGVIPFGISRIAVAGQLTVELGPLLDELPVIEQVNIFFVDAPTILLEFSGAAQVAGWPAVRWALRRAIDAAVAGAMVMPNSIKQVLPDPHGEVHDMGPKPIGVLKIHPRSARGLTASDWHLIGKSTSDPYLRMKFANTQRESSIVRGTCDPVWPEGESYEFVVYHADQKLSVEVLDYDQMSKDDLLGCMQPTRVAELQAKAEGGIALYDTAVLLGSGSQYVQGDVKGELKLDLEVLTMSPERPLRDCEVLLVMLEVNQLHIPVTIARTLRLQTSVGGQQLRSPYKTPPPSLQRAAGKAVDQAVVDMVRRGAQLRMSQRTLADMTGLPRSAVAQIVADGKKKGQSQTAHMEYQEVAARTQKFMRVSVTLNTRLSASLRAEDLDTEVMEVQVVDTTKKVLGAVRLPLKDYGKVWPAEGEWGDLEFTWAEGQDYITAEARLVICGLAEARQRDLAARDFEDSKCDLAVRDVEDSCDPGRAPATGGA